MKKTLYYSMNKPEDNDYVEIGKLNDNFDILDNTLHSFDSRILNIEIAETEDIDAIFD